MEKENTSNVKAKETDEVPDVSIIDYGINNLKSVCKAFEKLGKTYEIVETPEKIESAKALILPGIGAFGVGMEGLRKRGILDKIKQKVNKGTPMLGICLGMQMLFSKSEEFGINEGLDLIPGMVVPFKKPEESQIKGYKVPQMGWNSLQCPESKDKGTQWKGTLLESIDEGSYLYFVHSFYPKATNDEDVVANAVYGDQEFCAVVKKGNVTGTQFHPEKSGEIGLNMLKKFCEQNNI